MATSLLLAVLLAMTTSPSDGGVTDEAPRVQTGPEVGAARSDVSPPLRDLKRVPEAPGRRVHPWRRIPRPPVPAEKAPGSTKDTGAGAAGPPDGSEKRSDRDPPRRTRKKPGKPRPSPRTDSEPQAGAAGTGPAGSAGEPAPGAELKKDPD